MVLHYFYHDESDSLFYSNLDLDHLGNPDGCVREIEFELAEKIRLDQNLNQIPKYFKINNMKRQDLLTALEIVKPGLSRNEQIDQSDSFCIIDGCVITYNDEISISHPVEGLEIDSISVKADVLYNFVKRVKNDEINLEVTETELLVSSGKSKAGLSIETEVRLPIEEIGEHSKFKKLPANFISLAAMAAGACSTLTSEAILMCVNVTENTIQGSDSYKIVMGNLAGLMPVKPFLIPAKCLTQAIKINPTKIAESEGWILFKNEVGTILSCRVLEEKYPDITPYTKVDGESIVFPDKTLEVLERAQVFSKRENAFDEAVIIEITKKAFNFKAQSDFGWFDESLKSTNTVSGLTFSISPYLLKGILDRTKRGEINEAKLKFEGEDWIYISSLM